MTGRSRLKGANQRRFVNQGRSADLGLPRLFARPKHRQCNMIERMLGWLKENRRIVTRLDNLCTKLWRDALAGLLRTADQA